MSRQSVAEYTPAQLKTIAAILRKNADDIETLAEALADSDFESLELRNAAGIDSSTRWSSLFAKDGWTTFYSSLMDSQSSDAAKPAKSSKPKRKRATKRSS